MARLATSAAHFCQRLTELYPQKFQILNKQSEQSSPFRRWTTGSGSGSSYRHHDHRNMYNKQMSEGSAPVGGSGGGGGGVARWSLGLEQLLADPAGAAAFAHFLAKEFAAENIRFWWSCEQYSSTEDPTKRAAMAHEIWQRHLAEKASEPVNVDAAARRATALRLYQQPVPQDLFQQAQKQIFNVMKFDSYPRFLRSGVHAECARADLCGLPAPYAPPELYEQTDNHKQGQLKKSASNASERRRSGGASLLPWRLRRAPASPPPPLTDVVKSSQSAGQCSLCRVVLPDGATSVVGVEAGVTVRRLVDRLLQRRNLVCNTYDVLLKDADQGESATIDLSSPSTIIGGREVLVERRAVVRVEIAGRCVAVRCRAARRLRHVLRPVLARYAPASASASASASATASVQVVQRLVLRDGCHVHPDTLMQELDGARLQIIEVTEGGEYRAPPTRPASPPPVGESRDDDTDSLSDLALRLQEDIKEFDAQSASSSSRMTNGLSTTGPNLAAALSAGLPSLPPGAPHAAGVPHAAGALGPGGRVRAALRSGPPLHHHPPDFLENLRETQRQRLHSKEPSSPAPTTPPTQGAPPLGPAAPPLGPAAPPLGPAAPRAPPPLPPKPPQRAPTVV